MKKEGRKEGRKGRKEKEREEERKERKRKMMMDGWMKTERDRMEPLTVVIVMIPWNGAIEQLLSRSSASKGQ